MSKEAGGLSSTETSWGERRFLRRNMAEREKIALLGELSASHYRAHILYWKQQVPLRGSNQEATCSFLSFREIAVEDNNTGEDERGIGLEAGRLPRAGISKLLP